MSPTTARIGGIAGLALLLGACQPHAGRSGGIVAVAPAAPQNACMQIISPPGKPIALKAVAYDTPNLETCGMYLEGERLEQHEDVRGLWNGVHVFADARGIDSAAGPGAARYAIYTADQRQRIDQGLQQQLAEQHASSSKRPAPQP